MMKRKSTKKDLCFMFGHDYYDCTVAHEGELYRNRKICERCGRIEPPIKSIIEEQNNGI